MITKPQEPPNVEKVLTFDQSSTPGTNNKHKQGKNPNVHRKKPETRSLNALKILVLRVSFLGFYYFHLVFHPLMKV